jgi:serine protease Do
MRLGEVVLAIGNPFGVGQTVTMGIVSATGRSSMGIIDYEDFIQTDAAINPGNSGGALVNMKGELIGINTAILSRTGGSMGIGFAVPTAMAAPIMKSLLASGKVTRGYLGVAIQELDRDLAESLQLGAEKGVLVGDVTPGSAAEKAGLARGDLIRSLDGKPVDSASRFRNEIAARPPGSPVKLEVLRDGKPRTVEVQLGTLEEKASARMGDQPGGGGGPGEEGTEAPEGDLLGGVAVTELGPRLRRQLQVPSNMRGVVVTRIQPGAGADRLGLRPGDVLLEVNRRPVTSVADFRRAVSEAKDRVVVLVFRDGSTAYLTERD